MLYNSTAERLVLFVFLRIGNLSFFLTVREELMKQEIDDAREGITDEVIFWKKLDKIESRFTLSRMWLITAFETEGRQISAKIFEVKGRKADGSQVG